MRNVFLILFFGLLFIKVGAQVMPPDRSNDIYSTDSTRMTRETTVIIDGDTKYTDYKIISLKNDTTVIDTTLSIIKDYKQNFLRKDNFELMEFHNQGQTFNKLSYNFNNNAIIPSMGFNAKQYSYYTLNEVYYYSVPTPTSELFYKKGIQQGQTVDALLTANTSEKFNAAVAYKGLRSLGRYKNELASQKNFRLSMNFHNKRKTYFIRGHIYTFHLFNEENGGLTDQSIIDFEENNPDYRQRERMDVNYTDAESIFEGNRYFLDQNITLFSNNTPPKEKKKKDTTSVEEKFLKTDSISKSNILANKRDFSKRNPSEIPPGGTLGKPLEKPKKITDSIKAKEIIVAKVDTNAIIKKDSITKIATETKTVQPTVANVDTVKKPLFNLILGNSLMYETKHYRFNQESASSIYGPSFQNEISDHTDFQRFNGEISLQLNSAYVGSLKLKANYFKYNYKYNSVLYYDDYTIADKLKGNTVTVGADWHKNFGKIYLNADASTTISGDFNGNTIKADIMFKQKDLFSFKGYAEFTSKSPEINKLLYQSDYKNYNWQNNFANEKITSFGAAFNSKKLVTLIASYNVVDNYTYFNDDALPTQADETLNYYKIKLVKEFTYRKISLDNTVLYQDVLSGEDFLRVPNWVTRNSLYFSTNIFKGDPLYLQTGITFKYFSSFKMNAYNPVLNEFTTQSTDEIGNYPLLDLFVNFRIQRTRAYFKLENFTSNFSGRNYFSAPGYPYRDMTFRFGLVWNFFI